MILKQRSATPSPTAMTNAFTTGQLIKKIELYLILSSAVFSALSMTLVGFSFIGWLVTTAVIYLCALWLLSRVVEGKRKAIDRIVRAVVTLAFLLALIPLVSTLFTVVTEGMRQLSWSFITQSSSSGFNSETLEVTNTPGALQAIIGTLVITGIAALISIPIGLLTSIYLTEYAHPQHWIARTVTFLVDVMTGIPSIVAGLFAFSLFTLVFGPKAFSGFSAAVALSVLMIPTVVRSCEEMLRLVPRDLREASLALGVSQFSTIVRIVLPTAIAGIITGIMLAIARVIGETAPIFMAASFTDNFNANPLEGPMQTLPVLAYTGYAFPGSDIAASHSSSWGAALLLVLLVIVLNLVARIIAKIFAPQTQR